MIKNGNKFKTKEWFIPQEILGGTIKMRGMFLRGLFDSDGDVGFDFKDKEKIYRYPRIRLSSTNKSAILEVKEMLLGFGIGCYIVTEIKRMKNIITVQRIVIRGLKRSKLFNQLVGFGIQRKQDALNNYIKNGGKQQ